MKQIAALILVALAAAASPAVMRGQYSEGELDFGEDG